VNKLTISTVLIKKKGKFSGKFSGNFSRKFSDLKFYGKFSSLLHTNTPLPSSHGNVETRSAEVNKRGGRTEESKMR
jgi:hypothetical protein